MPCVPCLYLFLSVQSSVFRVQCSVCSFECSVFSVQCSVFSVQCAVFVFFIFLFFFVLLVFLCVSGENESFIAVTVLLDTAQVNAKVCGVYCKV